MDRVLAPLGLWLAVTLGAGPALAQSSMSMPAPGSSGGQTGPWTRPSPRGGQCFDAGELRAVAAVSDRLVILKVGARDYYRLGLAASCPAVLQPGARVVDIKRGSTVICLPAEIELKIAAAAGAASHCRVESMALMSSAELKALQTSESH